MQTSRRTIHLENATRNAVRAFGAPLLAVMLLAVLGSASASYAQSNGRTTLVLDRSIARERVLYAKLHIEERFGIVFHPYASVCPAAPQGRVRCLSKILTDNSGVPLSFDPAKQPLPGYSPKQLRDAYGVTGVATGATPIIGIVDAYYDPAALDDLKVYSKQFNLLVLQKCKDTALDSSVPCLQIANEKGGNKLPTTSVGSWSMEQSLDLDTAHALCENCSIVLIEADSNGFGDMFPAENAAAKLGANVISNSWGSSEFSGESSADSQFFTHPGVVMTAATGDYGYAGGVEYPSSSPNVVAVGGTSLFLSANGKKYASEVAWSDASSGCSADEARPSWQPSLSGCPNNRTVSDISVDADPNTGAAIYNSNGCTGDNNCWYEEGGTSMSAPIVAAMYALAGNVSPSTTQAASMLYQNATKKNSRDIDSGSTGTCEYAYLCNAVPGYDGPTGLGSPKGLSIFLDPQN